MLARNRFFRPKRLCSRHSSTAYPFHNVQAFRFAISQEEAIIQMAPYASVLVMFRQLLGSVGARLLPGFGFEPIRPKWITPVYFPAWVIDGELQASITHGDIQRTLLTQFVNTYLPGNDFEFMPTLSLWDKKLTEHELVPFTSELERQHDVNVQCLPYSISPFSFLDIAKNWPHGDVEVDGDLLFSPTSIKPTVIAAYPVLIPLYFAQYQTNLASLDEQLDVTIIMEAFSTKGRIFVRKYHEQLQQRLSNVAAKRLLPILDMYNDLPAMIVRGSYTSFARSSDLGVSRALNLNSILLGWLDEKLQTSETLYPLLAQLSQGSPTLQGKDERVRDFMNTLDRESIYAYLLLGSSISSLKLAAEATEAGSQLFHSGLGGVTQALHEKIDEHEKARREFLPPWWKEWEQREGGTREHAPQKQC